MNLIARKEPSDAVRVFLCGNGIGIGPLIVLLFVLLSGCVTPLIEEEIRKEGQGQITIYLNGPEQGRPELVFELSSLSIVADDGTVTDVSRSPATISSVAVAGRQKSLGEKYLQEGTYKELVFNVDNAVIHRGKKTAQLALPPEGITVRINVTIGRSRNTTIFLDWDSVNSIMDGYLFSPVFSVHEQRPQVGTVLLCVSNEGSNNVTLINRYSGEVTGTVLVGEQPRGIAASKFNGEGSVYVVNAKSDTVSVVNPVSGLVEHEVPIRFGRVPVDISTVRLASGREMVYTVNYGSDTVSIVDPLTLHEIDGIKVGSGPVAIAADPPVGEAAGTRFLDPADITILNNFRQKNFFLYVANRNASTVSVLRMNREGDRAEEVLTLGVGWEPVGFSVDYSRGKVYVANYSTDKVSVIDIIELIKGNTSGSVGTLNDIGYSTIDVISDQGFERLYLLSDSPAELRMVRTPGDSASTFAAPTVIASLPLPGSPRSMVLDPETGKLFVVDYRGAGVTVVDKTSVRVEKEIPVGVRPYDIAIIKSTGN